MWIQGLTQCHQTWLCLDFSASLHCVLASLSERLSLHGSLLIPFSQIQQTGKASFLVLPQKVELRSPDLGPVTSTYPELGQEGTSGLPKRHGLIMGIGVVFHGKFIPTRHKQFLAGKSKAIPALLLSIKIWTPGNPIIQLWWEQ